MTGTRQNVFIITRIALFAAVTAVLSQISIPLPSGVPITLQTFAVALAGCVLGKKHGTAAIFVYIALGSVGLPVFSSMRGGMAVISGATGGFIIGFLPMAALCGFGAPLRGKAAGPAPAFSGLAVCHICGLLWFSAVTGTPVITSALTVSLPFLLKDALSVAGAFYLARLLRRRLKFIG